MNSSSLKDNIWHCDREPGAPVILRGENAAVRTHPEQQSRS